MKTTQKRRPSVWLLAAFIGAMGTFLGFGVSTFFPTANVWEYDWMVVRQNDRHQVDSSITLVTLEEKDAASCGPDRWNTVTLAQSISALSQAQAKVIGLALPLGIPTTPECGDLAGLAKLIEATKQAGRVVYPLPVPEALASEAAVIGTLDLKPDEDGVFRQIPKQAHDPENTSSQEQPFGLAMALGVAPEQPKNSQKARLLSFVGPWRDRPFPTIPFGDLWEMILTRDYEKLSALVKNKFVLVIPLGSRTPTLKTPLEEAAPIGFLHANLLENRLSQSWVTTSSWWQDLGLTLVVAIVVAWVTMQFTVGWGVLCYVLLILGLIGVGPLSLQYFGYFWPFTSPMLASGLTLLGTMSWTLYRKRTRTEDQIQHVKARLAKNQEELVKKERLAQRLNIEVTEAKERAHESTQKYREVAASAESQQQRLHHAQVEVETSRQRLETLQSQLDHLHHRLPSPTILPPPLQEDSLEKLREECQALGIFTRSPTLLKVFQDLKKGAPTNSPILLLGETGTGKEVFAQATHHLSKQSEGPFISINMAAIRPELFESELFGSVKGAYTGAVERRGFLEAAHGGTLFLDEVGELPYNLQPKLLRVLEDGSFFRVGQSSSTTVDVRVVAATNRELMQEVQEGRFREDLYYRLRSIVLSLLPLRERGSDDIAILAHHFIEELGKTNQGQPVSLTVAALQAIQGYSWPGNIRELRQTLAQAVALAEGPMLSEEDLRLPHSHGTEPSTHSGEISKFQTGGIEQLTGREDTYILSCLRHHQFDMKATAKALNWDRGTVTQRLKGIGFQSLVDHDENIAAAAATLAGTPSLVQIVEMKLREYYNNLVVSTRPFPSAEEAIADSRRRLRNLPDRHFPAVETLIRQHFQRKNQ